MIRNRSRIVSELHAGAESLRGESGFVHPAPRAAELRSEFDDIEAVLGPEEFDRAWRRGAGLDRDQLIELARQELASPAPTGDRLSNLA